MRRNYDIVKKKHSNHFHLNWYYIKKRNREMLARLLCISFATLLTACSGSSSKTIEYSSAKSMPGYGYIVFDFSNAKEIDYGRGFVPGKTDYTINYVSDNDFLSVSFKNAEFDGRILKAYVPYMKGYRLYNISRLFWYSRKDCEKCNTTNDGEFVKVYLIDSIPQARCEEASYKNNQKFEYYKGCNNMEWIERSRKTLGSVIITPHFHSGYKGVFTPFLKPGHSSAGS